MKGRLLPPRDQVRAVVFDIYGTLLQVRPGAADPETAWAHAFRRLCGPKPCPAWADLDLALRAEVKRVHSSLRRQGVEFPEVSWPHILQACVPVLHEAGNHELEEVSAAWAAVRHRTEAMPGAVDAIRAAQAAGLEVAVASNAQDYTLREIDAAGLWITAKGSRAAPLTSFYSFAEGFAKPSPMVFEVLAARLGVFGVRPEQILMIGDREDNDVAPALAAGWHAWHFCPAEGRDWPQFCAWLGSGSGSAVPPQARCDSVL